MAIRSLRGAAPRARAPTPRASRQARGGGVVPTPTNSRRHGSATAASEVRSGASARIGNSEPGAPKMSMFCPFHGVGRSSRAPSRCCPTSQERRGRQGLSQNRHRLCCPEKAHKPTPFLGFPLGTAWAIICRHHKVGLYFFPGNGAQCAVFIGARVAVVAAPQIGGTPF